MGFSQRRTVAYLYGWTLMLAGVAVALRFVPYSNHHGTYHLGWVLVMAAIVLIALAAQRLPDLRARDPQVQEPAHPRAANRRAGDTSEHEIDERVQREVETGEFERVG